MMPLVFVLAVAAIIGLMIWGLVQAARRRRELAAWAWSRNLRFSPLHEGGLDARFGFDCLAKGEDRYGYNVTSGDWGGREFLGFDYHYETHSTDSKGRRQTHHHHFSAVVLASRVVLQPLFIRPEGFLDKVTEFFGFDDIDFESAEFSRKFYVKAPDRKWAYDVIHPRTMEFLLAQPRFTIQFNFMHAIVYRGGTFKVADFAAAAETLAGLLDRLPQYVIEQQGGELGRTQRGNSPGSLK